MTASSDHSEPTRAQLERIAFGRAETPADIAAAQDALRRLVEADAASASVEPEVPEVVPHPAVPDEGFDAEVPVRRRRTLVPLLIVVGLLAGAAIGILVTRPEPATPIVGAAAASGTPTPAPTPDPAAALKSLLVPQTKADKGYPLPEGSGPFPIQPASVHRILTASDGTILWTARSDTGICLMSTQYDPTDDSIRGAENCVTPSDFALHGLTISEDATSWSWNGLAFTAILGN